MTDDNSNVSPETKELVDINDDLDAFEKDFFQKEPDETPAKEEKVDEKKEDVAEIGDDRPANDDDTDADEDAKPTEDEDETEDEADELKPEDKPKSKTQKRIEKLLERERLANERAEALEQRLAKLETSSKEVAEPETQSLRERLPADAPNPDATDKAGNPIYPLGEFDKDYIRDITAYSVKKELAEAEGRKAKEVEAARMEQARTEIQKGWLERLDKAEEDIPDLREDISDLTTTFQGIQPEYGEYLATAIMANPKGPEIMHYLSQNIGEAQKIVASGPTAAILALGRLEARFTPEDKPDEKSNRKQSNAPKPPENRSRGSGAKVSTAGDTDDLDAFEKVFFKK